MTRKKITEEAKQKAEEQSESNDSSESDSDREQLTQRMPKDLVDDVDEIAEHLGISRNAAVNMMCRRSVPTMKDELGL